MDLNDLRIVMTVAAFLTFLGVIAWAYSGRRKDQYDQAARTPLDDEERPALRKGSSK